MSAIATSLRKSERETHVDASDGDLRTSSHFCDVLLETRDTRTLNFLRKNVSLCADSSLGSSREGDCR